MLEVPSIDKPRDTPCEHLAAHGCSKHDDLPCGRQGREFICVWKDGFLPKSQIPSKTHVVVWYGPKGVWQVLIAPGHSIPHPTWEWLMRASREREVCIDQAGEPKTVWRNGYKVLSVA